MPASREGSSVPNMTFKVVRNGQLTSVGSDEIFKGRRVGVCIARGVHADLLDRACTALRGAGTRAAQAGVDDIICLSVNDPFVMAAWQREQNAETIVFSARLRRQFHLGHGDARGQERGGSR